VATLFPLLLLIKVTRSSNSAAVKHKIVHFLAKSMKFCIEVAKKHYKLK